MSKIKVGTMLNQEIESLNHRLEIKSNLVNTLTNNLNECKDEYKELLQNFEGQQRILEEAQHELVHLTQTIRSLHYAMNLMQGEIKKFQIINKIHTNGSKDSLVLAE